MDKEAIKKDKKTSNYKCENCKEFLLNNQSQYNFKCGHNFHKQCLKNRRSGDCTECKKPK